VCGVMVMASNTNPAPFYVCGGGRGAPHRRGSQNRRPPPDVPEARSKRVNTGLIATLSPSEPQAQSGVVHLVNVNIPFGLGEPSHIRRAFGRAQRSSTMGEIGTSP